jgi:ADP-L-glycero-D-manno-heptose 6-epimerase
MIIVTGAAGFIGSCLVGQLNRLGFRDLVLVDDFSKPGKENNYNNKNFTATVDRSDFTRWIAENHLFIQFVFHLGARTDTTEFDVSVFDELNLEYSKRVWNRCVEFGLPLVYASSAATYGTGEHGYDDDHDRVNLLKPLNPYGESKNEFDRWALSQERKPYFWAGLKLFNVYGPNEYHKRRMASVIFHAFNQIRDTGRMKLFRSHHPGYKDGEQLRDFICVHDATDAMIFLMNHRKNSGIYNLGTGCARTFNDLVRYTFDAMNLPQKIEYINTPEDIRDKYQYFTEAKMDKLRSIGYTKEFTSLEQGIHDYVRNFLIPHKYF